MRKLCGAMKRSIIFSNHNFSESILEIRATLWDGDMVIDHPYAVFMSRSALLKKMLLPAGSEALHFNSGLSRDDYRDSGHVMRWGYM